MTDPLTLQAFSDEKLREYIRIHVDELDLLQQEVRRRKGLALAAAIAKNPLQAGDSVKTAFERRTGRAALEVVMVNAKSVNVVDRFYLAGRRIPLNRIVWAQRDGVDIDLSGIK